MRKRLLIVFGAAALIAGCGGDDEPEAPTSAEGAVTQYLNGIEAGDAGAACAAITDTASEEFVELMGETQTSTELTGTICVENLNPSVMESLSSVSLVSTDFATEPAPEAGQTYVDVDLETFDREEPIQVRFRVEESAGEFTIVGSGQRGF